MTAATAKDILNLGHHTVPPALQAVRVGPNRTPASARMAAATAKDTMQVGRTSVSRMRLIGARHARVRDESYEEVLQDRASLKLQLSSISQLVNSLCSQLDECIQQLPDHKFIFFFGGFVLFIPFL